MYGSKRCRMILAHANAVVSHVSHVSPRIAH